MALESPNRDGARLNNSGARLGEGARLGDNCAGPAIGARDSSVDESYCKIVNTVATVPARAATVVTANQQPQDTMFFYRYLQAFLLAWNRRFFNDTCHLAVTDTGTADLVFYRYLQVLHAKNSSSHSYTKSNTHFREFNLRVFNFPGLTDILSR